MNSYLFVYGTLKRSSRHPMARRLEQIARRVGSARIAGRLYNLGRFPGLKEPSTSDDWVVGDLYDLGADASNTLKEMDFYENAESPPPTPYERLPASVICDDGLERLAWVYWYRGPVADSAWISSGNYETNASTG